MRQSIRRPHQNLMPSTAPLWIRGIAYVQPVSGAIVFGFAIAVLGQWFFGNPSWTDAQSLTRTIILVVLGVMAVIAWLLGKTSRVRHYLSPQGADHERQ